MFNFIEERNHNQGGKQKNLFTFSGIQAFYIFIFFVLSLS